MLSTFLQVRIPNALHWGGINDRFAYGDHSSMLFGYMTQFEAMFAQEYVKLTTSEDFLCKHLVHHQVCSAGRRTPRACCIHCHVNRAGIGRTTPGRCADRSPA